MFCFVSFKVIIIDYFLCRWGFGGYGRSVLDSRLGWQYFELAYCKYEIFLFESVFNIWSLVLKIS